MKSKLFLMALILVSCTFFLHVNAQLKVSNTGSIGICLPDSIEPLSKLSVCGVGYSNARLSVDERDTLAGIKYGIRSHLDMRLNSDTLYAIYGKGIGKYRQVGIYGEGVLNRPASEPTYVIYGLSCGVKGKAGGSVQYNYGVWGELQSEAYGAGIFGTVDYMESISGTRYAGYFRGQTKVNGDFYATTLNTTSDARLKTNISDVTNDALIKLQDLHSIQFKWQQIENGTNEKVESEKTPHFSSDIDFDQTHYGFLAQDVQKLFPELVHEDANGYLSVNYVELIPLLVNAVQQLSAKVEEQNKRIDELQLQSIK